MERYVHDAERIDREWAELSAAAANVELSEMASDAFLPTNAQKNRYADILPCMTVSHFSFVCYVEQQPLL